MGTPEPVDAGARCRAHASRRSRRRPNLAAPHFPGRRFSSCRGRRCRGSRIVPARGRREGSSRRKARPGNDLPLLRAHHQGPTGQYAVAARVDGAALFAHRLRKDRGRSWTPARLLRAPRRIRGHARHPRDRGTAPQVGRHRLALRLFALCARVHRSRERSRRVGARGRCDKA